jgi:hypothetical protein
MQQPQNPYGAPPPYQQPQQGQPGQYPFGPVQSGYGGGGLQPLYRQNGFVPPGASASPLLGPGLRKGKLALGIVQVSSLVLGSGLLAAGIAAGGNTDTGGVLLIFGGIMFAVWYLALMAYGVVGMIWIYKFWSWIPPEQRHTPLWKKYVSPGQALGFMFLPYFNIYWMFVLYLGIADILERMRVAYPTERGPAKNLALLRVLGPMVCFPAAPFFDYIFDKHVEGMAADMQARMPGGNGTVPALGAGAPAY